VTDIHDLLRANQRYVDSRARIGDARPKRQLAIVTCMDARIDVFAVLGLHLGDAHVLRNAGGRVTEDVLRSLALSTHALGVETVILMQHTRCGLSGVTDEELQRLTGADVGFLAIDQHDHALVHDIETIVSTDYLGPIESIAAFVLDIDNGALNEVARWSRKSQGR
jgi:carbonic anhydrase